MKDSLDFYLAGSEVHRYHTVRTLAPETVGHHSHGVAVLALVLTDWKASAALLRAALVHDLAEHQTGDIPSPAKREYGIGQQVEELEARLMGAAGVAFPHLYADEARVLKLADIAQGALYCVRELELGNRRMVSIYDRYMSYARDMILLGRERELFDYIQQRREAV